MYQYINSQTLIVRKSDPHSLLKKHPYAHLQRPNDVQRMLYYKRLRPGASINQALRCKSKICKLPPWLIRLWYSTMTVLHNTAIRSCMIFWIRMLRSSQKNWKARWLTKWRCHGIRQCNEPPVGWMLRCHQWFYLSENKDRGQYGRGAAEYSTHNKSFFG